jgi:hypothetical protein
MKKKSGHSIFKIMTDHLKRGSNMTATQKMQWLEDARDFYLKAIPKNTLRASFELRRKENS